MCPIKKNIILYFSVSTWNNVGVPSKSMRELRTRYVNYFKRNLESLLRHFRGRRQEFLSNIDRKQANKVAFQLG